MRIRPHFFGELQEAGLVPCFQVSADGEGLLFWPGTPPETQQAILDLLAQHDPKDEGKAAAHRDRELARIAANQNRTVLPLPPNHG